MSDERQEAIKKAASRLAAEREAGRQKLVEDEPGPSPETVARWNAINAEHRAQADAKQERLDKMIAALRSCGIQMEVHACGCCDGPWVSFSYRGEQILDSESDCSFDTGFLA